MSVRPALGARWEKVSDRSVFPASRLGRMIGNRFLWARLSPRLQINAMRQDWFIDLYDDFRMRTGFGSIPVEQTCQEVDFLWDVLALAPGSKVLDLFSGAGRHSKELARRGCMTTGIEQSCRYVELARAGAPEGARFLAGDVRTVDFGSGFDGAIIMFHSFGYFTDEEDRQVLAKIHQALRSGGRFLVEILNRDWVLANFQEREQKMLDGVQVVETRRFDALTSRNHFRIERHSASGTVTREGAWRLYSPHEMKGVSEAAGLEFLDAYATIEKAPLSKDTRLMRMLFRRA